MIKLGDKVKDTITGFEGVAVAECEYLYGCKQFQIEGVDKDGAPKSWWFDFQRIEEIEMVKKEEHESIPLLRMGGNVGGPQDTPPRRSHPASMTSDSE